MKLWFRFTLFNLLYCTASPVLAITNVVNNLSNAASNVSNTADVVSNNVSNTFKPINNLNPLNPSNPINALNPLNPLNPIGKLDKLVESNAQQAEYGAQQAGASQMLSESIEKLIEYFINLGHYLGFDVTQNPSQNKEAFKRQALIDPTLIQLAQMSLFNTFLGAVPVNAISTAFSAFVPTKYRGASILNSFANTTFNTYNNPSSEGGTINVSPLIDQQTYQADPVTQSVLNILGTPDYTYCFTGTDASTWSSDCSYPLIGSNVSTNVIGTLPDSKTFFAYDYIQTFLGQLNSDSLTAPLLYSTENSQSSQQTNKKNAGLTAQNQAQQAANFVRYVSGSVIPIKLPQWRDYDTLYTQATANTGSFSNVTPIQKFEAQSKLSHYLANLRTYAAQSSVGISNLYYILSKRLPQDMGNSSSSESNQEALSQALSEFKLATWRIFDPDHAGSSGKGNTQWINKIDKASSATIQKEIAVLLAEISYQMYLDRQLQERILLTNSIMLLQNTHAAQPDSDLHTTKE